MSWKYFSRAVAYSNAGVLRTRMPTRPKNSPSILGLASWDGARHHPGWRRHGILGNGLDELGHPSVGTCVDQPSGR
ncbi:MAG: hypothetical protein OEM32_04240, partial [Acidimicrobiia bacterium]|nr:hypothetical protein [Acidimicrobiia bacterium]